ncbi:MAG: flagellar brake protein [Oscillospiraceae bacterium]|jgi:c-di-GMP-binding flagellar brake protein YcgR|nr:flagellar brake protein [Oscillospiraceae bacterium]
MKPKDSFGGVFIIGEKLELHFSDNARTYKTVVQDRFDNGDLVISSLYSEKEGGYIYLKPGTNVTLVCYREIGRFMLQVSVIGLWNKNIGLVHVTSTGSVVRQQRREWLRVPMNRPVNIDYKLGSSLSNEKANTYNISATGACIRTTHQYPIGALLDLTINLGGQAESNDILEIIGEVRSCVAVDESLSYYRLGTMFKVSHDEVFSERTGGRTFEYLAQYIQKEDLRLLRLNRLY